MLTEPISGNRIDVNEKYPNKGIYRGGSGECQYHVDWQAYYCKQINYRMLIIESLDHDSETRRLSPVAVATEKYIDLINGPQDHGWCHGYTCQKRISTFNALVAMGKSYEIYLTSYNPKNMRFKMLHANSGDAILVQLFNPKPQRLDIYTESKEIYYFYISLC